MRSIFADEKPTALRLVYARQTPEVVLAVLRAALPSKNQITLSFNGAKFAESALNSLIIPRGIIAFVCLDFPKFIAVKMRSTLKPYFLDGCDEDLRRRTVRTSSEDLPQQAKKTALRLDGVQISLG